MFLYILPIILILSGEEVLGLGLISLTEGSQHTTTIQRDPIMPVVTNGSSQYYFGLIFKGTATQAEAYCHLHNMELLSIETLEEDAFVRDYLETHTDSAFVGQIDLRISGKRYDQKWIWSATGNQINYTNWYPNYPIPNDGYDCMLLGYRRNMSRTWWWNHDCNLERYFICES